MFIIDKKSVFCPDTSKISPFGTNEFKKKLTSPSSRILEGLIMSNGDIVPYKELYKLGWGDHHVNIRPNTLYQHISLLRRAFDDCGIDGKKIVTHQRKGISLAAKVTRVEDLMDNTESADQHKHSPPINFRCTMLLCFMTQSIAIEMSWEKSQQDIY